MGIFRQFPYTNFHELNLDEILEIVTKLANDWVEYNLKWGKLYEDIQSAFDDFKDEFDEFIDSIDYEGEIRKNVNRLVDNGTFDAIISPKISPLVTAWLNQHLTPSTEVVIDSSLTIAGAAADAKAVGDKIDTINTDIGTPYIEVDGYTANATPATWQAGSTYLSVLIPIKSGDKFEIKATNEGSDTRCGILRNVTLPISTGDTVLWSNDTKYNNVIAITQNNTYTGTAPSDAKYLYCYYGLKKNNSRKPQKLIINGFDYVASVTSNLVDAEYKINEVYDYTYNEILNKKISVVDGTANLTATPPAWNSSAQMSSYLIPVKGGERLTIKAGYNGATAISFLRSFSSVNGTPLEFSTETGFTTGLTIANCLTQTYIIPSDVRFIVIYRGYNTNLTRIPEAIIIDGVDYLSMLSDQVVEAQNTNEKLNTVIIPSIKSVNHGGYHTEAPWNSLPAFKLSKQHGFSWVETDVQFTSDDIPVLCHDDYINNYAKLPSGADIPSTVYINQSTYAQLQNYDFGIGFSPEYAGLKITTLEELFRLGRGVDLGVRVELKNLRLPTNTQIDVMITLSKKYGMFKKTEWISANLSALQYITRKYPDANVVLIVQPISAVANMRDGVNNARKLQTGLNQVTIYTDATISENYAKIFVDNGFIVDVQVSTLANILAVTPYVTSFTSNYLVVEDALKEYYMNN